MPKFKIFAGLGGSFGGAQFQGVYEFTDEHEADQAARELCVEEYESYGGYHSLYTWDSMRQEIADSGYDGDIDEVDPEDVDMALMEEMEGWFAYRVIPVSDETPLGWDGYDDEGELEDDDTDCYCE